MGWYISIMFLYCKLYHVSGVLEDNSIVVWHRSTFLYFSGQIPYLHPYFNPSQMRRHRISLLQLVADLGATSNFVKTSPSYIARSHPKFPQVFQIGLLYSNKFCHQHEFRCKYDEKYAYNLTMTWLEIMGLIVKTKEIRAKLAHEETNNLIGIIWNSLHIPYLWQTMPFSEAGNIWVVLKIRGGGRVVLIFLGQGRAAEIDCINFQT